MRRPTRCSRARLLGDGVAIDPTAGTLHAPCDGEVVVLPRVAPRAHPAHRRTAARCCCTSASTPWGSAGEGFERTRARGAQRARRRCAPELRPGSARAPREERADTRHRHRRQSAVALRAASVDRELAVGELPHGDRPRARSQRPRRPRRVVAALAAARDARVVVRLRARHPRPARGAAGRRAEESGRRGARRRARPRRPTRAAPSR